MDTELAGYEKALSRKGADKPCPICGGAFGVPGRSVIPAMNEDGTISDRGVRAIGLACQSCGFIRHHAVEILAAH